MSVAGEPAFHMDLNEQDGPLRHSYRTRAEGRNVCEGNEGNERASAHVGGGA